MHLRDGSCCNRFAEEAEQFVDGFAQAFLDQRARFLHREGRQLVLQKGEVFREVRPDNVGPRRKKLPELDIGRAQCGQCRRKPLTRIGICLSRRFVRRALPGKFHFRKRHQRQQQRRHFLAQFEREKRIVPSKYTGRAHQPRE